METQPTEQEIQAQEPEQQDLLQRGLVTAQRLALLSARATSNFARKNAKAAVAATLFSPMLAAPLAFALEETHDVVGPEAVTIKPNLEGETIGKTGIVNAYLPVSACPFGATVISDHLEGKVGIDSLESFKALIDNNRVYVQSVEHRLIDNAIEIGLIAEGALALGGTIYFRKHPEQIRKLGIKLGVGVVLLITGVASDQLPSIPQPDHYVVHALDGTELQGTAVDNPHVRDILDNILPTYEKFKKREDDARKAYVSSIVTQEDLHPDQICPVIPNTIKVTFISDTHAAMTVPPITGNYVDLCKSDFVALEGDETDNSLGSEIAWIKPFIKSLKSNSDRPVVGILGNHDSYGVGKALKAMHVVVLDGKVMGVVDAKGDRMTFAGNPDPRLNPPYDANRVPRDPNNPLTEEEVGKRAYEEAVKYHPDIELQHEPDAANAFIKAAGTNPLPVKALDWGHIHKEVGPFRRENNDGTVTELNQSGTAGGKGPTTLSFTYLPSGSPTATASLITEYFSTKTHDVLAYQKLQWSAAPNTDLKIGKLVQYEPTPDSVTSTPGENNASKNPADKSDDQQADGDVTKRQQK